MFKDQSPDFLPFSSMNESAGREQLRTEIERGHFARAALLAASLRVDKEELQELRIKALWQMSAVNRNGPGTKRLAQEYGFSKKALRQILLEYTEQKRHDGESKPLEPCYDYSTGKYLTFEEWLDHFLQNWDKLSES